MSNASAPEQFSAVHSRWSAAQEASEKRQVAALSKVDDSRAEEAAVMRMGEEDEEEAGGMLEAAQLIGASAPADLALASGDGDADAEFERLISQLRVEPSND